jgi:hypothetical protein
MPLTATAKTVTRRIELPMLRPISPSDNWSDFGKALNECHDYCARAYNTALAALFVADVQAMAANPDEHKLPTTKDWPNIYKLAVAAVPKLPPASVSALCQLVRKRYLGKRSDGIPYRVAAMRGLGGLPQLSEGRVMPVRNQEWTGKLSVTAESVTITVPLLRVQRGQLEQWTLELKRFDRRGNERRQVGVLRKIAAGEIHGGQVDIYRKGRHGVVMVGVSARVPVGDRASGRTAICRLHDRAIFAVTVEGQERPWLYNADGFRRRARAHAGRLQRLREDYKFEPRQDRSHSRRGMEESSRKQRLRVNSVLHSASAWLINFCLRQGCDKLVYDDSGYREFVLPASRLRKMVEEKAEVAGIVLIDGEGGGGETDETVDQE